MKAEKRSLKTMSDASYGTFSLWYDALMDDFSYDEWCTYYVEIASLKAGMQVVDAACGTGNMTLALAKRGLKVTGVDVSEQMLGIAMDKSRREGMRIPFVCQDMRSLQLHHPVDAVIAACDGVNYLTKDALSFFQAAYNCLRTNGVLAFDVSTASKYRAMDGQVYLDDRDDVTCLWTNRWSESRRELMTELILFSKEGDKRYRRSDETHVQHAFDAQELARMLAQAGFEDIRFYADRTLSAPDEADQRMHITAIRGNE